MGERERGIPGGLSLIWFYGIAVAAPFYCQNQYFDILQAKARICGGLTGGFLLLLGAYLLWRTAAGERPAFRPRFGALDGAVLLFGALALASCLGAEHPGAAFWGMEGWGVGGAAMAGLALCGCLLTRFLPYRQNLWLPVMAANLVLFLLTALHAAGRDVLGLHRDVAPEQWFYYLSTIGNRNWYAGYLCLLVPMAAVFYLSATERSSECICLLFLAPACLNLVLCASDSLYLGLGLCLFFALPFVAGDARRVRRSCVLLVCWGGSLLAFGRLPAFEEMAMQVNGLSGRLLHPAVGGAVTAAGVLGAAFLPGFWEGLSRERRKGVVLLLEALLLAAALGFLLHAVTHFSDRWGTNRGRTWRVSLELYRSFPLRQKLLGVGPEGLGPYYRELSKSFTRPILSAHSEPVQLLLTNGALGLLSWGSVWAMLVYRYFRDRVWERDAIAFFLPLAACFGQGLVNSPQPLNTALLCLMTACLRLHLEGESTGKKLPDGA